MTEKSSGLIYVLEDELPVRYVASVLARRDPS